MEQFAILVAVWYASSRFYSKELLTIHDLEAHLGILVNARNSLQSVAEVSKKSSTAHWISTKLITVLNVRIEQLESLLRLHPLMLGTLRK